MADFTKNHWREQLHRLESLDLPLVAVGHGADRKAPCDPASGGYLNDWQNTKATANQIRTAHRDVIACGTRTGAAAHGVVAFDLDGETAVSWCLERGCDPLFTPTWQVHRNTDENRLKVLFRLTDEQLQQLGDRKKIELKPAVKDANGKVLEKGEAIELFRHGGLQVIVLGQHWESKGHYFWPDGMGPEDLAPIPDCWWQAALELTNHGNTRTAATTSATGKGDWRNLSPCPICGRPDGWCQQHRDGKTIRCAHGSTYAPPSGLKRGDEITDKQGTVWAFSQEQLQRDGETFSVFVAPDASRTASKAPAMAVKGETTKSKPEPLTFEQRWELLELHAAELACTTWPVMKTVASLACKASELEIPRLGQRQLEQLLEQAQRKVRAKSEPVMGGGTFTIQPTPWAVDGLFRHGLNLLVGQSGAGKSRLAAACMASWLRGDATWLQRRLHGIEARNRHALIIGTDQSLTDWHLTLGPVGLTTKVSDTEVRVHDRLTLYGLESGLQLDADGLNTIRRWVDAHPGGMVLVDSLAQCLPAGIDEDKSSAARPVHQLQEVLGDAWAILTHHTRKGAGKEGNIGVGAGRGSGAIDAAVSRVIGLGLIHKMENGQMVAQESDPRRELLSTKRGGKTEHLIVSSDANGFWDLHGTADALKAQERQQRALSNLTDAQSDVLAAVEAADGWISTRDVVKTLLADGEEYDATSGKAATARKALKRLEVLGLIETQRVGNDRSYRAVEPAEQREVERKGSTGSTLMDTGISLAQPLAQPGSTQAVEPPEPPAEQVEPVEPVEPSPEPMVEPAKTQSQQGLSRLSHQPVHAVQSTGSTIPGFVDPTPAAVGSGADVMDDDDDPHWGPKPQGAAA